jgi:hypothetical protein
MAGTLRVGGKVLATHNSETDEITLSNIESSLINQSDIIETSSGTSHTFTNIPSWVKKIDMLFDQVSVNTSDILIQIGGGGSVETTNYFSGSIIFAHNGSNIVGSALETTTGFALFSDSSVDLFTGRCTLNLFNNYTYIFDAFMYVGTRFPGLSVTSAGRKEISAVLDTIKITTNGSDNFDNGKIRLNYY